MRGNDEEDKLIDSHVQTGCYLLPQSTVKFPETYCHWRLTHVQYRGFVIKVMTKKKKKQRFEHPPPHLFQSKSYAFEQQRACILTHSPISALDSHSKHRQRWERTKNQGRSNSRILLTFIKSVKIKKGTKEGQIIEVQILISVLVFYVNSVTERQIMIDTYIIIPCID